MFKSLARRMLGDEIEAHKRIYELAAYAVFELERGGDRGAKSVARELRKVLPVDLLGKIDSPLFCGVIFMSDIAANSITASKLKIAPLKEVAE